MPQHNLQTYGRSLSERDATVNDDLSYYRTRALQEDECVRKATCEQARDRHLELASAYRMMCAVNSNSQRALDQDVSPIGLSRR